MYKVGAQFLTADENHKKEHLDTKNENLGYCNIEGVRDFIKLRATGDRNSKLPQFPEDFKENFEKAHHLLAQISWELFCEMVNDPHTNVDPTLLPEDVMKALKECLGEMASTSCIRYYLPPVTGSNALRDVCDEHTDTGIFTLILCSQEPGLQIWDRKKNCWMEIEKKMIETYKAKEPHKHLIFCIMGEKIQMFTGATSLIATKHRVMVAKQAERYSLLYFMDTSK